VRLISVLFVLVRRIACEYKAIGKTRTWASEQSVRKNSAKDVYSDCKKKLKKVVSLSGGIDRV
jgi:hypothetical protein